MIVLVRQGIDWRTVLFLSPSLGVHGKKSQPSPDQIRNFADVGFELLIVFSARDRTTLDPRPFAAPWMRMSMCSAFAVFSAADSFV